MMDAASDDPVEMIAKLASGMMAERRGRFLDAACGGDANLRAEIEARLIASPKQDGSTEQPSGASTDQVAESGARLDRIHRSGGTLRSPRPERESAC